MSSMAWCYPFRFMWILLPLQQSCCQSASPQATASFVSLCTQFFSTILFFPFLVFAWQCKDAWTKILHEVQCVRWLFKTGPCQASQIVLALLECGLCHILSAWKLAFVCFLPMHGSLWTDSFPPCFFPKALILGCHLLSLNETTSLVQTERANKSPTSQKSNKIATACLRAEHSRIAT